MTPYCRAFALWHSFGAPAMSWNEMLTWFFHHGAVISLPDRFLLARRIRHDAPVSDHLSLASPLHSAEAADCWNIWLACGSLRSILATAALDPLPWVSFVRRGGTNVKLYRLDELAKDSAAATASPAARLCHRPGKGSRRP